MTRIGKRWNKEQKQKAKTVKSGNRVQRRKIRKGKKNTAVLFLKQSFSIWGLVAVVVLAYQLHIGWMIYCLGMAAWWQRLWRKNEQKRRRYQQKYQDVTLYMEQMIYSFQKQPKIRAALLDAQTVSSIEMKNVIERAIGHIDQAMSAQIYTDALSLIAEHYACRHLYSLHRFLIKIETHGGSYHSYADVLLADIKAWSDGILSFQADVARVRRNVLISIVSTLMTCGMMVYLIPAQYRYISHPVYQFCSAQMIVLLLFAYLWVCKKLNFDWIADATGLPDQKILPYYLLVEKGYHRPKELKWTERSVYQKAKKRLEKEITKAFPDWVREVAMNLQNDTVQSAIEHSYVEAPLVLKRPIRKLLIDFETYPVGIEPYDRWLKEMNLPEIKSSIKMFYAFQTLGQEETAYQLGAMIARNDKMMQKAERMKNQDMIGAAGMLSAIPLLTGVVKIALDMVLMMMVFAASLYQVLDKGM